MVKIIIIFLFISIYLIQIGYCYYRLFNGIAYESKKEFFFNHIPYIPIFLTIYREIKDIGISKEVGGGSCCFDYNFNSKK